MIQPNTNNKMNSDIMKKEFIGMFMAAAIISMGPPAMAIEEPSYIVLETEGNFELRKYSSYIVAETYVEGDFEAVGSEGFRRLADYIGGKNQKKESISMTSPVIQKPASEKIAMTAPVSQARENGRWRIAFMMPSAYTMDTLPIPDDDRIALREEKEKKVAVIRYSGSWGKKRYENHATKLMEWIATKGWKMTGAPVWARYDPPFMPWFMRRNEILIPVQNL
ncbi:MAG: heme-binding protein [Desulfobacterales bacterium]